MPPRRDQVGRSSETRERLDQRFGINHLTVQLELGDPGDLDANDGAPHGLIHTHAARLAEDLLGFVRS